MHYIAIYILPDPLRLLCYFRKTLRYFVQVCILAAILEYTGIGRIH